MPSKRANPQSRMRVQKYRYSTSSSAGTVAISAELAEKIREIYASASSGLSEAEQQSTKKIVDGLVAKERATADAEGSAYPYGRQEPWMFFLGLTNRELIIIARIYSFQCTGGAYRMSLQNGAAEIQLDKANFKKLLRGLVDAGFLLKSPAGPNKPVTYTVDVNFCLIVAERNGFVRTKKKQPDQQDQKK